MSAAESIQKRIKGMFPDLIGMEFVEAGPDLVTARLKVRPNPGRARRRWFGGRAGENPTGAPSINRL